MGYCVEVTINNMVIPFDKMNDCLAAINNLHTKENLEKQASGGCSDFNLPIPERIWYSWVQNPPVDGFFDLPTAFRAWRYDAFPENDSIVVESFRSEKLGDDEILFRAIAPFVNDGAIIEFDGEDGSRWRYVFENGEIKEQEAKISWE